MTDNSLVLTITVIAAVLVSITLHEAMHAFAGHWLGDDTARLEGRLTLNPLKHIDPFLTVALPVFLALSGLPIFGAAKPVPFNPNRVKYDEFGAALVGLAGPLTNLVLAVVAALVLRLFGMGLGAGVVEVFYVFIAVNIGFFVFNMIPFPPLDGSRVLYALAPEPLQRVMYQIETLGLVGLFVFMLILFPAIQPIISTANNTLLRLLVGG
jgi:Zn-dependent protease